MNLPDLLKYGNQTVVRAVDGLPDPAWERGGVCGVWSVKQIIMHLASFEQVLLEVLTGLLDGGPTPTLDQFRSEKGFNDDQVARRAGRTRAEVWKEYADTHAGSWLS